MVATAAVAGSFYAVIQAPPNFSWIVEIATGATIGGIISSCIIGFELFGESRFLERGGHRLPLAVAVTSRAPCGPEWSVTSCSRSPQPSCWSR